VYEHDPVAGWMGDGCNDCHRSHGSANPRLLKSFSRGLCAQCHTDKSAAHYPGRTCWRAGCHVSLHGSNTDRLFRQP
jgi:predicted CXXCH cytochrome family protein